MERDLGEQAEAWQEIKRGQWEKEKEVEKVILISFTIILIIISMQGLKFKSLDLLAPLVQIYS